MAAPGCDSRPNDSELDTWFAESLTDSQQAQAMRRTPQSDGATATLALNGALMWTPVDRRLLEGGHLPRSVQRCIIRHDPRDVVRWVVWVVAGVRGFALRAIDNLRRLGNGSR